MKFLPKLLKSYVCVRNRNKQYSMQRAAVEWLDHPAAAETTKWRNSLKNALPFLLVEPCEWVHHLHDESFDPEKRLKIIRCQNGDNLYVMTVPRLSANFLGRSPKGFNLAKTNETKIIMDTQRLKYCDTFVKSLRGLTTDFSDDGVLFSGPNGVGKSSICLVTFLTCFVRSFPVVYIPLCDAWVAAASAGVSPNIFFMERFFLQNADIIVSDPQITPFFLDQLEGAIVQETSYFEFAQALEWRQIRPCGFIADEAQKLPLIAPSLPEGSSRTGDFATDFTIWTGPSGTFTSQLSACNYGLREFQLPSGEEIRLKFVLPFEESVAKAAMREPSSPFYVPHATDDMLERMFKAFGGMPRVLWYFAKRISHAKTMIEVEEGFTHFKREQMFHYFDTCRRCFINRSSDKVTSVLAIHNILRGGQFFDPLVKALYDYGLCYLEPSTRQVRPVNQMAEQALQDVFHNYAPGLLPAPDRAYGFLFKAWLQISILRSGHSLSASPFCMPGAGDVQLPFNADVARFFPASVPFSNIPDEIKIHHDNRVLWVCSNSEYPCDGIIVPSRLCAKKNFAPIMIFDASVEHRETTTDQLKRLKALRSAMKKDSRFKKRDIVVILFHRDASDATIRKDNSNYPHFYTLDRSELAKIGINF